MAIRGRHCRERRAVELAVLVVAAVVRIKAIVAAVDGAELEAQGGEARRAVGHGAESVGISYRHH